MSELVPPLPSHAHLPGQNVRHGEDFLDHIKAQAPPQTRDANAGDNQAWLYGLRLIECGYFWEAHEILETVWMRTAPNSREFHLVQGVIHLANGALKVKMNRPNAALRLKQLAMSSITEAYLGRQNDDLMGLKKSDLVEKLNTHVTSIE
ncbi:MAG: DUF309 domain-containing protein [Rhizobiaceae bacterium]